MLIPPSPSLPPPIFTTTEDLGKPWDAHKVELALWAHHFAMKLKPDLLRIKVTPSTKKNKEEEEEEEEEEESDVIPPAKKHKLSE